MVLVDPQVEQKRPQQDERMDQVIGLLGGKMAVEKLEATAGMEKEGRWALRQVEHREEGETLPLLPPPRSPRLERRSPLDHWHLPLAVYKRRARTFLFSQGSSSSSE